MNLFKNLLAVDWKARGNICFEWSINNGGSFTNCRRRFTWLISANNKEFWPFCRTNTQPETVNGGLKVINLPEIFDLLLKPAMNLLEGKKNFRPNVFDVN